MTDTKSEVPSIVTIRSGDGSADIAPAYGGLLLNLSIQGRRVIHCYDKWLDDYPQALRAGNPVLFPVAGHVGIDGRNAVYQWEGQSYRLAQHGFARHLPWKIVSRSEDSLAMRLASTAFTLGLFPWEFELVLVYQFGGGAFEAVAKVTNKSDRPMPTHFGFHPYFALNGPQGGYIIRVPEAQTVRLASDPTSEPVKPESREIFLTTALAMTRFYEGVADPCFVLVHKSDGQTVTVSSRAKEFSNWAIWSPDRSAPYVCIEPWTAAPNAINTRKGLPMLEPGQTGEFDMKIAVGG